MIAFRSFTGSALWTPQVAGTASLIRVTGKGAGSGRVLIGIGNIHQQPDNETMLALAAGYSGEGADSTSETAVTTTDTPVKLKLTLQSTLQIDISGGEYYVEIHFS